MKNIFISRLKYTFTAKGRHGTHSPFIYAFVERVLRGHVKISADKKTDMLYRILNYMRPGKVFVTTTLYDNIKKQAVFNTCNIQLFHPDNINGNALYVFDIDELSTTTVNNIAQAGETKVLVFNLRINKDATRKWNQLKQLNLFTYSMDCFSFGLLLNDKAFRVRQHFVLK